MSGMKAELAELAELTEPTDLQRKKFLEQSLHSTQMHFYEHSVLFKYILIRVQNQRKLDDDGVIQLMRAQSPEVAEERIRSVLGATRATEPQQQSNAALQSGGSVTVHKMP